MRDGGRGAAAQANQYFLRRLVAVLVSRHLRMTSSRRGEISGLNWRGDAAGLYRISPARAEVVQLSKGRRPVTISYSTAPMDQMSLRGSAASPPNCSGAIYGNVPEATRRSSTILRVASSARGCRCARPKSSIFTRFSGFVGSVHNGGLGAVFIGGEAGLARHGQAHGVDRRSAASKAPG
jgi:hypothetical protein